MGIIKNYDALATSDERKIILQLIEAAFNSIDTVSLLKEKFKLEGNIISINEETVDLNKYKNIYLLGFGKGSAQISSYIEKILGDKLTKGYVIDVVDHDFDKIEYTKGTHPVPSPVNNDFTKKVLKEYKNLSDDDLVLIVTCGGGSALLIQPNNISIEELIELNEVLLRSGANITEMNIVRKHLSNVKGGDLEAVLYPAKVMDLIFSDVPGNDFSVIASGPTVIDKTTIENAKEIFAKYDLESKLSIKVDDLSRTSKDPKIFEKVTNVLMLSNITALQAMESKSKELGRKAKIFSDTFQSEAKIAGKKLIAECEPGSILLIGGETTVKVTGKGKGGRNQEVVLGALQEIDEKTTIASVATDGWDFFEVAGAIGDQETMKKANASGLNINNYLIDNDSLAFFKIVGDTINTGRLPSNVSDLIIVLKK